MPAILIVEDNDLNRDMLARRLQRRGFDICLAHNGQEGLALALQRQPDVILMDLGLPDIDGWETTRHLKADPATGHIPVIALTAHALSGDREKALAAGCDDYDTKPVVLERLLEKIQHILGSKA